MCAVLPGWPRVCNQNRNPTQTGRDMAIWNLRFGYWSCLLVIDQLTFDWVSISCGFVHGNCRSRSPDDKSASGIEFGRQLSELFQFEEIQHGRPQYRYIVNSLFACNSKSWGPNWVRFSVLWQFWRALPVYALRRPNFPRVMSNWISPKSLCLGIDLVSIK